MGKEIRLTYPEIFRLRPNVTRKFSRVFVCAFFTIGGIFMIATGEPKGWICVVVFGPVLVLALLSMIPGAEGLVVMPEGFAVRTLFRTRFYEWKDVSEFGVFIVPAGHVEKRMVGFRGQGPIQRMARVSAMISGGYTHCLADSYSMKADALAAELNAYRERAMEDNTRRMQQSR